MEESKSIFASKTFWVNVISAVAGLGAIFGFDLTQEQQMTLVTAAVAVVPAINIVVRLLTHKRVTVIKKQEK